MKKYLAQYSPRLVPTARMLRKQMTDAERKLWSVVRGNRLGLKFRRQVPFGPYILDFFFQKAKLNIELAGSQHGTSVGRLADKRTDKYLRELGNTGLRYSDTDVLKNIEGVVRDILEHLNHHKNLDAENRHQNFVP